MVGIVNVLILSWLDRQKRQFFKRMFADRRSMNELCVCSSEFESLMDNPKGGDPWTVCCWACAMLKKEPIVGHLLLFRTWRDDLRCRLAGAFATGGNDAATRVIEEIRKGPGDGNDRASEALAILREMTDAEIEEHRRGGEAGWHMWRAEQLRKGFRDVAKKLQSKLQSD